MPGDDSQMPDLQGLWREYDQHVELYKFYMNMLLRSIGAFYLVTGAIATFALANEAKDERLAWAVAFPMLMSGMFGLAAIRALPKARELARRVADLGQQLQLGLTPQVDLLVWLVSGLALLMSVTLAGLTVMFVVLLLN